MRRNFWYRSGQKWLAYSYLDPRYTGRAGGSPGGMKGYAPNLAKETPKEESKIDTSSPIIVYVAIGLVLLLSVKLVFGR